jgi:hypothetical protein
MYCHLPTAVIVSLDCYPTVLLTVRLTVSRLTCCSIGCEIPPSRMFAANGASSNAVAVPVFEGATTSAGHCGGENAGRTPSHHHRNR